jgi:uncharacterized protein (TIGR04255 family)
VSLLPDYKRVIYEKNPLVEVVCQLNFPATLSIEAKLPVEFHKSINENFPSFDEGKQLHQTISGKIDSFPIDMSSISNPISTVTSNKIYVFSSEDNNWTVNLTRSFISLASRKYKSWKEFNGYFEKPIELLQKIYEVKSLTRIGLRYVDLFKKSDLGLSETPWKDLIKTPIAGILSSEIDESLIYTYNSDFALSLEDGVQAFVRTTLLKEAKSSELCFMLDSDLSIQSLTAITESSNILKKLNINANRILQFAIKEKLHNAMNPKDTE